jgi:hypothetical protein
VRCQPSRKLAGIDSSALGRSVFASPSGYGHHDQVGLFAHVLARAYQIPEGTIGRLSRFYPVPCFLCRAVPQAQSRAVAELLLNATDMARSCPFVDVLFGATTSGSTSR